MPARLQHGDETFTVEYRPLRSSARLDGLLVVVRDVTKQIESERVEAEQRELTRMVQRIVRDKTGFLDFLAESHEMVGRLLAREPGTDEGLRLVHTLKGNCAVYGILSMSDLCDVIETRCAERGSGVSAEDSRELGRMWEGITSKVNELVGGAGAQGIEIDDQEYATIIRSILHGAPRHDLLEQIVAWRLEPTRVRLQRLADQATGLAQRLGKAPVVVGVEDNGLRLPASQWQRFWSAAVHVVRNAVDHGLEAPGERAQLGKGPSRITLRTQLEERNVVVEIEDDGRGVDWDKIQARGRSLGLPCETHDDLVALMLRDGVSTRDQASSTSGRGVGMAAVREACAMLGGQVLVRSEKGRGSVIRFSFPRSVMVDQTAETILAQPVVLSLEPAPVLRFLRSIAPAGRA
jgi:chemotaxis protein histidine kinase CheA